MSELKFKVNGSWETPGIPIDSEPIEGSARPVSSGGVFEALKGTGGIASGFVPKNTYFNEDGSITEEGPNYILNTIFNDDGSIIETLNMGENILTRKIIFNNDGSIIEVIT